MEHKQSLNHTVLDCKYHVVWIPKYRKKVLYGELRKYFGEAIRDLAQQKESNVWEGHLMADHVHMLMSIPPKYAVAHVVGYINGKSAIYVARNFGSLKRNFTGEKFWARGYFVSTLGRNDDDIREYIKKQENEDRRFDQLKLFE